MQIIVNNICRQRLDFRIRYVLFALRLERRQEPKERKAHKYIRAFSNQLQTYNEYTKTSFRGQHTAVI